MDIEQSPIKLIFLGSGSAFTVENSHSNMVIQMSDRRCFLIDCGSDARKSLFAQGLSYNDIGDVYISHLHADHAGGLEWLGFTHCFRPFLTRPNLYIHETLIKPLWENTLKGGMSVLEGKNVSLDTFFMVNLIKNNLPFTWNNIIFETVQTIHTYDDDQLNPSYGLFFKLNDTNIFITTDTQFFPDLMFPFYQKADLIFHDCETMKKVGSSVHARFEELVQLPAEIKQKMWLYHYNDGKKPDAIAGGFLGYVTMGMTFEF